MGNGSDEHCAFVLLAEFDIDRGAQLTYQFPQPLGTDESLLAHQMLPDGAERQLEDWTIFFLNQTPFNRISPVLALESDLKSSDENGVEDGNELLYVLNLVRTKHDKTVRRKGRGAVVKAMAICTRHPFIQIFKPVLLMALDDYFADPSQECLARLFDAVNAMDMSNAPTLSRDEKLIMRISERKDIFIEKFTPPTPGPSNQTFQPNSVKRPSQGSNHHGHASHRDRDTLVTHAGEGGSRSSSDTGTGRAVSQAQSRSRADSLKSHKSAGASEASGPSSLGGSTVWVGEDGMLAFEVLGLGDSKDKDGRGQNHATPQPPQKGRRSMDSNSTSSHVRKEEPSIPVVDMNSRGPKDTHFYTTSIVYCEHTLPTKMPLATFPEEVGDYSLITLIQTFSAATTTVAGPQHPHLHTNGERTHPIILLFNALITNKRIIFLGFQRPAGQVASMVLAACALGSGCGAVLRGFISRAFPYANLTNRDEWEQVPGFIAGVTNPIFKSGGSWDVLCDLTMNSVGIIVNKDIHASCPVGSTASAPPGSGSMIRAGTIRGEPPIGIGGSEEDVGRMSAQINAPPLTAAKSEFSGKADSSDNLFMEDIVNAIQWHFGETLIRARFTEYVQRFVRLAARYEEEYLGSTKIGYPTAPFDPYSQQLGSGLIFPDDVSASRELALNAYRIEGWRRTKMYEYYMVDFQHALQTKPIQGFDVYHQIVRLKTVKNMSDQEAELIMRTLAENVQTYDQVVELLSLLPQYLGGLLPLTFGLFHQQDSVRNHTVDLLTTLRIYPIGVQFLQNLNHFHRYAFVRQAHARETKSLRDQNPNHVLLSPPLPNMTSWTPSNRSESSLGGN
ncbi:hypothetical protein ACEPAI_9965 [Sanghuangporus weigelae]